jgi:uncharacterized protein DUF2613
MKAHGNDRGGITMAVIAPVVAALLGGTAAVLAAAQIVNLAPSNSDPGPAASQLPGDVQYGDR